MSATAQNLTPASKPASAQGEAIAKSGPESMPWLPCTLSLDVPIVHFTIADLLTLKVGSIVETACHHTSDVPVRVNQVLIGWSEFDVLGDRLAVRITEQA